MRASERAAAALESCDCAQGCADGRGDGDSDGDGGRGDGDGGDGGEARTGEGMGEGTGGAAAAAALQEWGSQVTALLGRGELSELGRSVAAQRRALKTEEQLLRQVE